MKQYKIYKFILFDYTPLCSIILLLFKAILPIKGCLAFGVNVNSLYYHHQHPRLPLPRPLPRPLPVVPLPLPHQ